MEKFQSKLQATVKLRMEGTNYPYTASNLYVTPLIISNYQLLKIFTFNQRNI